MLDYRLKVRLLRRDVARQSRYVQVYRSFVEVLDAHGLEDIGWLAIQLGALGFQFKASSFLVVGFLFVFRIGRVFAFRGILL